MAYSVRVCCLKMVSLVVAFSGLLQWNLIVRLSLSLSLSQCLPFVYLFMSNESDTRDSCSLFLGVNNVILTATNRRQLNKQKKSVPKKKINSKQAEILFSAFICGFFIFD